MLIIAYLWIMAALFESTKNNCWYMFVASIVLLRARRLWLFYHLQLKHCAAPLIRARTSLSGTRSDMHFASEVWRTWYGADGEWEEVLRGKTRLIICGKVWMVAETFRDERRLSSACAVKRYVGRSLFILLSLNGDSDRDPVSLHTSEEESAGQAEASPKHFPLEGYGLTVSISQSSAAAWSSKKVSGMEERWNNFGAQHFLSVKSKREWTSSRSTIWRKHVTSTRCSWNELLPSFKTVVKW